MRCFQGFSFFMYVSMLWERVPMGSRASRTWITTSDESITYRTAITGPSITHRTAITGPSITYRTAITGPSITHITHRTLDHPHQLFTVDVENENKKSN